MKRVAVAKLHGAGNDFVLVDARRLGPLELVTFARNVCDRHFGIGADGLLVIEPSNIADVRMRIINADGSEAQMCGNGIRCVARFLDESHEGEHRRIETAAGIIATQVLSREPVYMVRVRMRAPRVSAIDGESLDAFVDMGNAHAVLFRDDIDSIDLASLAERFQDNPRSPDGVNVHVATVVGGSELRVRHYERGAGATLACGTGAVACAAAALTTASISSPVDVRVPGGHVVVEWDGIGEAFLTGPAVRVFDTTFALA